MNNLLSFKYLKKIDHDVHLILWGDKSLSYHKNGKF